MSRSVRSTRKQMLELVGVLIAAVLSGVRLRLVLRKCSISKRIRVIDCRFAERRAGNWADVYGRSRRYFESDRSVSDEDESGQQRDPIRLQHVEWSAECGGRNGEFVVGRSAKLAELSCRST